MYLLIYILHPAETDIVVEGLQLRSRLNMKSAL